MLHPVNLTRTKVATLTRAQAEEIAKTKMPDLNAANLRICNRND